MTGWNTNRRKRLPPDWQRRRRIILERDPVCRLRSRCEGAASTEVDHIIAGDHHDLANLQGVCTTCHRHKTATERPRTRERRTAEPHPGEL